jgi:hypothetical protein
VHAAGRVLSFVFVSMKEMRRGGMVAFWLSCGCFSLLLGTPFLERRFGTWIFQGYAVCMS